jgi:His/Glu/Gln/Arg/opine family amino acid ABC transporter permease subunit
MDRIGSLIAWTPFLVGGFSLNILIALTATAIGTVAGALLCMMMLSTRRLPQMAARGVCAFFRTIPTLVLVFYLATFIPNQIVVWDQHVIDLPKWISASIAFAASPASASAATSRGSRAIRARAALRRCDSALGMAWTTGRDTTGADCADTAPDPASKPIEAALASHAAKRRLNCKISFPSATRPSADLKPAAPLAGAN